MDRISQEIVYHLADLQYESNEETGQRWPVMLAQEKRDILNFRATCRAFRDASWIPFRNLLAERIFYLNESDLTLLGVISEHPRLSHLVTTLTFGSQIFTSYGLHILDRGLETHPLHVDQTLAASPAWQRGLPPRCELSYGELAHFRELYEQELYRQEQLWSSGQAVVVLSSCLYRLSSLRAIRVCPRACHVTYKAGKANGILTFTSRSRTNHFVPHGAVGNTRCDGWRNIDRTLRALSELDARYDISWDHCKY
jgi:hypothetical protein